MMPSNKPPDQPTPVSGDGPELYNKRGFGPPSQNESPTRIGTGWRPANINTFAAQELDLDQTRASALGVKKSKWERPGG